MVHQLRGENGRDVETHDRRRLLLLLLMDKGLWHWLLHILTVAVLMLLAAHVIGGGTRSHYLLLVRVVRHAIHLLSGRIKVTGGALVGTVGHSCHSALHVAVASVLQLAHQKTKACNQGEHILVATLVSSVSVLLVGLFVPLFFELLLATLLGFTKAHADITATKDQVRGVLCLASTFALFVANETKHRVRDNFAASDLAKVREELIKLLFGSLWVQVAHNQVEHVHGTLPLESALRKIELALLL